MGKVTFKSLHFPHFALNVVTSRTAVSFLCAASHSIAVQDCDLQKKKKE